MIDKIKYSEIIPSVKDCKLGNCSTYFPQFKKFTKRELHNAIKNTLEEPKDSYFNTAYKNARELKEIYKKCLNLPFQEACERLFQLKKSYINYKFFMSLHGEILVFEPCCA